GTYPIIYTHFLEAVLLMQFEHGDWGEEVAQHIIFDDHIFIDLRVILLRKK
ncbi:hypothetical protein ACJX0J_022812, partial [Zea mays]